MTSAISRRGGRFQARVQVEQLEDRRLLANNILYDTVSKVVTINGTAAADSAQIKLVSNQISIMLTDIGSGATHDQRSFSPTAVKKILFNGGDGNDVLINDTAVKVIAYGEGGNDYLEGGDGEDKLYGGTGDDILIGWKATDKLYGEAGLDQLFGMQGKDTLDGGADDDALFGGAGTDTLIDLLGSNTFDQLTDGDLETVFEPFGSAKLTAYFADAGGNGDLSQIELDIFNLVNQERTSRGLAALSLNTKLSSAAQHHATNMAAQNRMAHELPSADLPTLLDRLNHYNYNYNWAGENIAYGYSGASAVMNGWMNSSGHRANILNTNYTEIGIGVRYAGNGTPYYCQVFGRPG
jgi:uncharacterized protein YkwD